MPRHHSPEEIFAKAVEICNRDEQSAYLDQACGDDQTLRAELEDLLRWNREACPILDFPDSEPSITLPSDVNREGPGTVIGRYKLLEQIGEGGMATVFMAEQERPILRHVALKIIKLGMDTKQVIGRFEAERQALALMDHPNIAKVHDAGTTETGRPYFVMELVRGEPITQYCDGHELTTRERLELFIPVCQAVQHAHQRGIIHRDLKPTNILVALHDGKPVPKVIDFGIAKAVNQKLTEKTVFTRYAQIIGTPEYMSPEQAELSGLDIDTRTDVFSLGVLLYELLTGSTPFDADYLLAKGYGEMQRIIREEEPVKPSTRLTQLRSRTNSAPQLATDHSSLATELDWIVMKTLEKDRSRRYESVSELAAEIHRHLNSEPVLAGRPSTFYRLQKAFQRHRTACLAIAAAVLALVGGLAMASLGWHRAVRAQENEQIQRHRAEESEATALAAEKETRLRAYAGEMITAMRSLEENNLSWVLELLERQRPAPGQNDLRGFAWRHLWQRCQSKGQASFSDGNGFGVAFSPDGKYLALATWDKLVIRNALSPNETVAELAVPGGEAFSVAFSPNSEILVCAGLKSASLWDTHTWRVFDTLPNCHHPARFSPDGLRLVTASKGGFQVWRTGTWERERFIPVTILGKWSMQNMLAFSPDGSLLLTPRHDAGGNFQVWRFPSLEPLSHFAAQSDWTSVGTFMPDGEHLLIGQMGGEIHVWDIAHGAIVDSLNEHKFWITDICFSPDGRTFGSASNNGRIVIWDTATREVIRDLTGHLSIIRSLAMSPDGRLLASASGDRDLKLWDMLAPLEIPELSGTERVLGYSGDGRHLVAANGDGAIIWDLVTRQSRQIPISGMEQQSYSSNYYRPPMAFHGPSMLYLMGTSDGVVRFWNLATEQELPALGGFNHPVSAVAVSADGRLAAAGTEHESVEIWDVSTERTINEFAVVNGRLRSLAFSPDARYLAVSGSKFYDVVVWDIEEEERILERPLRDASHSVAFSPDGRLLAAARGKDVLIWEFPSGSNRITLRGNIGRVRIVAFLPDGKTLASMGDNGRVKLWSLAAQQEVGEISLRQGDLRSMAVSDDGRHLAVGYGQRIRLWTVPTLEEIESIEADKP